jgi:hypothetical protein
MSKHTPGPWEVVSKAGYPAVFGGNRVLCSPGGYSIGELKGDKAKAAEIVANANLIAAAPEMYEALQQTIYHPIYGTTDRRKEREFWQYEKTQGREEADARITALDALDKAEGRQ